MSEDGGEKQLGILASITAAIEATQTEIRSVQIRNSAETYEARVQLTIPLNGVNGLDRARIETDHTEVVDNNLQFDLTLEIDGVDQRSPSTSRSISQDQSEVERRPNHSKEPTDQSGTDPHATTKTTDDGDSDSDEETTETSPVVDTEAEQPGTEPHGEETTDFDHQKDRPQYQNPEQLAAVYNENATFEEMRNELGVDVTAQTVRKYMIKHGIHEPEPRPDRLLETIRASELELMNSEHNDRSEQAEPSTESDTE